MNLASSLIIAGLFNCIAFSCLPLAIANAQDAGKKVILSPNAPNPIGSYHKRSESERQFISLGKQR
jgi:hypothetical protein